MSTPLEAIRGTNAASARKSLLEGHLRALRLAPLAVVGLV